MIGLVRVKPGRIKNTTKIAEFAGIIWNVCQDETGQSRSFSTSPQLENSYPGKTNRAQ